MSDPVDEQILIRVLRTTVVAGVVLALFGTVWLFIQGHGDLWWSRFGTHNAFAIVFLSFLIWGMIPRQPRNPVVWALVAMSFGGLYVAGLAVVASMVDGDLVTRLAPRLDPSTLPPEAGWVMVATFAGPELGFFPLITIGFLFFPDGILPTPRWRVVVWLAIVSICGGALAEAWAYRPASNRNESTIEFAFEIGFLIAATLSLIALVVRFRHSAGSMRQQFKWIVWGASILAPALVLSTMSAGTEVEQISRSLVFVAGLVMLGSYAVAVARYRLYDVDLVINRTVVFVGLAGFITLVYAGLVVGAGQLVGGGEGLILPIVATAVVAVAFEPVRRRTQAWANRLVYGRRATPYEVLSNMTERLAGAHERNAVLGGMARLLEEGTGAGRVTVWLGLKGDMAPVAAWPSDAQMGDEVDLDAEGVFLVSHDGEVVGALELVAPPGSALSSGDISLVSDVAGSAGLVLGYQRLNDSLAERAAEVEESRARLVGAEDEERRRLEDDLRGAVHDAIGELEERTAAASVLARKHEASDLASLLEGIAGEAATALSEVRSLAQGLYPPVLASEGLTAAVCRLGEHVPVEVVVREDGVTRYPAGVEAAVYFNVSEAITNAVKHANPPIRIELTQSDDTLRFSVLDHGPGFDVHASRRGSGLENMADRLAAVGGRLRIASTAGGTEVHGEIPLTSGDRKETVA